MTGLLRYPGGKTKLKASISSHLNAYAAHTNLEYREPFFGGGSVGLQFIHDNPKWSKIWINDKDVGVANLWTAVIQFPEELKAKVMYFTPSIEAFDQFKEELLEGSAGSVIECAFKKLAIHQISYSGLGTMSGGPLGGREQKSAYKIDCRWSPAYICKKIDKLHSLFSRHEIHGEICTSLDFTDLISSPGEALIYLDPPYYMKGNDLYQCGFTQEDHNRLAKALESTRQPWVLSYDDCPEVRALYDWAEVEVLSVNYSITATKDKDGKRQSRTKPELLIYPTKHKGIFDAN